MIGPVLASIVAFGLLVGIGNLLTLVPFLQGAIGQVGLLTLATLFWFFTSLLLASVQCDAYGKIMRRVNGIEELDKVFE